MLLGGSFVTKSTTINFYQKPICVVNLYTKLFNINRRSITNLAEHPISCFGRFVLLTYRGSKTGFQRPLLAGSRSKIISVIKPTSRRPEDEGTAFTGFMGTCILLV